MIEITQRNTTTDMGLAEAEDLVQHLEEHLEGDLHNFESRHFFCRVGDNNGRFMHDFNYSSWALTNAHLEYRNGSICIVVTDDEQIHDDIVLSNGNYVNRIQKMDFHEFAESLRELITTYNEMSKKKDREIDSFIDFCTSYRSSKRDQS